jgi:hypothetical protein
VAVLNSTSNYTLAARTILQDTTAPYRYSEEDLKEALGLAMYEAHRLRPDLFLTHNAINVPDIDSATLGVSAITMDKRYRLALVHFMVGHVMKRDEEEASEARASAFLQTFRATLTMGAT